MKPLLVLTAALLPSLCLADSLTARAPVTEAVLFPDQAELTRTLTTPLPAGDHELRIEGLPELDLDNLQVVVEGARLSGVRQRLSVDQEDVSRHRQRLDDDIRELEHQLNAAKAADKLDQKQIDQLLTLLGQAPRGPAMYSEVPVDQWPRAWEKIRTTVDQYHQAMNQRARQRDTWKDKLAALKAERQQLGSGQAKQRELVLDVAADRAGQARVSLRYFTRQAGWQNQLRVDLDTGDNSVNVQALALIRNRTGEDWQGVRATLGLIPAGYRALPSLSPWVVGLAEPQPEPPVSRSRQARDAMAEPAGLMVRESASKQAQRMPAPVAHGFDMRVPLNGTLTLASDSSETRLPYQQASMPVTLARESYLWQQPAVLLVGEWRNQSRLPWLAGEVTLLRDGQRLTSYRRRQNIEQGEEVRMSFGDDPRLQVEVVREPTKKGETGLISKEKTLSALKKITVTSSYQKPVTVSLLDRLPVAGDDAISVSALGAETDDTDVEDVKGLRRWQREIPAEGERSLEQGFRIAYPAERTLSGVGGN